MFAFFSSIATMINTVVNFVINFFVTLMMVIVSIVRGVSWLFLCVSYLPPWLMSFLLVPVSLAVVFQILNKGD